ITSPWNIPNIPLPQTPTPSAQPQLPQTQQPSPQAQPQFVGPDDEIWGSPIMPGGLQLQLRQDSESLPLQDKGKQKETHPSTSSPTEMEWESNKDPVGLQEGFTP
ncbi:hypothetical protein FRB90_009093, partial [Tulasnella sp. 427]